jgi:uncharacterized membrane protein
MAMAPRVRKLGLTAHVVASVGWLGAVAGFLALALAGLTSGDPQMVRGAYLTMELIGWFVLVPLSIASLLTGLVQSVGTPWGLFRHYWVVMKLVINVVATAVLLIYMQTLSELAGVARQATVSSADLGLLRSPTAVVHSGVALLLLLTATVLAVYKPRGRTRYGRRKP